MSKKVLEIELLENNQMSVKFSTGSLPLLSFALKIANLELDNMILGKQHEDALKNKPRITIPDNVLKSIGGNGKLK